MSNEERNPKAMRLALGEAFMHCNECGAKLYSFDGDEDSDIRCPYIKDRKTGKCTDKLKTPTKWQ